MGRQPKPVQELIEQGVQEAPIDYVVPALVIPLPVINVDDTPVVNLSQDMRHVVSCVRKACKDWGFLWSEPHSLALIVINHGISEESCSGMMAATRHFYNVPVAQKMKYFTPCYDNRPMRYSTSFNAVSDQVLGWKDVLRFPADSIPESTVEWPSEKHFPRDAPAEYFKGIKELGSKLLKVLSLSLGLDADHLTNVLSSGYLTAGLHFYPPCPDPEHVYGIAPHSDPGAITMLLQDSVSGLQMLNKDQWIRVKPYTNCILVNLGDQLEVLSNEIYKSVVHRVIPDKKELRISIATFLGPSFDTKGEPIPQLIDEKRYNGMVFKEYMNSYMQHGLNSKNCIEHVRLRT